MNERNGFKETETGWIPEEWEVVCLGNPDIAELIMGQSPPSETYNTQGKGLPFFQGKTDFGLRYPIPTKWCSIPVRIAEKGDVLVSVRAPVGDANIAATRCCIGRGLAAVRAKSNADSDFLFFLLMYEKNRLNNLGTGAIFKAINKKTLLSFKFGLPPLHEQHIIAWALRTIQAAMETQKKIIASLRELKQTTMEKLFREGLRGEPLKEAEIGEMPQSWRAVRLGDVCSFTTGKLNSEQAVKGGKYPFFTCSKETFTIDSYSFDQEAILLAGNNAQGIYSVKYYKGKFDAYQRTYVITIKAIDKLDYRYLLYDLSLKLDLLRWQSLGATTKYLTATIIKDLKISLPTLEEQLEIAYILSAIDTKIENTEKKRDTLQALFKIMLHHLMTGQIRVNHLEVKNHG